MPARILDSNHSSMDVKPPRDAGSKESQSFGDLVASIDGVCGQRNAGSVVRLAVNPNVVVCQGGRRFVVC